MAAAALDTSGDSLIIRIIILIEESAGIAAHCLKGESIQSPVRKASFIPAAKNGYIPLFNSPRHCLAENRSCNTHDS
ncbi:hypothetical protein D1AOALGA4SA_12285 [Olavius algarvensis Delta 1 endosymbiont]|nr:hypothetical protein D1AOALGA4SA_12285 [Olavius algarvensis Delta 1 endosymbiont]